MNFILLVENVFIIARPLLYAVVIASPILFKDYLFRNEDGLCNNMVNEVNIRVTSYNKKLSHVTFTRSRDRRNKLIVYVPKNKCIGYLHKVFKYGIVRDFIEEF